MRGEGYATSPKGPCRMLHSPMGALSAGIPPPRGERAEGGPGCGRTIHRGARVGDGARHPPRSAGLTRDARCRQPQRRTKREPKPRTICATTAIVSCARSVQHSTASVAHHRSAAAATWTRRVIDAPSRQPAAPRQPVRRPCKTQEADARRRPAGVAEGSRVLPIDPSRQGVGARYFRARTNFPNLLPGCLTRPSGHQTHRTRFSPTWES